MMSLHLFPKYFIPYAKLQHKICVVFLTLFYNFQAALGTAAILDYCVAIYIKNLGLKQNIQKYVQPFQ